MAKWNPPLYRMTAFQHSFATRKAISGSGLGFERNSNGIRTEDLIKSWPGFPKGDANHTFNTGGIATWSSPGSSQSGIPVLFHDNNRIQQHASPTQLPEPQVLLRASHRPSHSNNDLLSNHLTPITHLPPAHLSSPPRSSSYPTLIPALLPHPSFPIHLRYHPILPYLPS